MDDKNNKINIATQTLERNIKFINICDQKTSIVLTSIGVLLTVVLTNDGLKNIRHIIECCLDTPNFCDILFLLFMISAVVVMSDGLYSLLMVLFARISEKTKKSTFKPSRIFFTGINSCVSFENYKSRFIAMNDDELLEELLEQIYINSDIAVQKYKRYNSGLKCSIFGFLAFAVLLLIGSCIY